MSNATVIESPQTLVLFSYATPVAYFDKSTQQVYRTTTKHSKTTSKHINLFFKEYVIGHLVAFNPIDVDQETLNKQFPLSVSKL